MRLGFYTVYSEEIAQFAQETGFRSLELSAWPQTTLNADTVNDEHLAAVRRDLDDRDIEISALGYYPNYLHPDPDEAAEASRYLLRVMELAHRMEVRTVCHVRRPDPRWRRGGQPRAVRRAVQSIL